MAATFALLIGACCTWPVHAALYRCTGDKGEMAVVDRIGHYRDCKLISGSEAPRPAHRPSRADQI
ncbi:MAG: hypothetical protein ACREPP_11765, partial [Rhodanobacteraceae bacterium]